MVKLSRFSWDKTHDPPAGLSEDAGNLWFRSRQLVVGRARGSVRPGRFPGGFYQAKQDISPMRSESAELKVRGVKAASESFRYR